MDVIWKPIINHAGYEISNHGQVRTYWTGGGKNRFIGSSSKPMKTFLQPNGYLSLRLKKKNLYVHRLVAMMFVNNPDQMDYVDHVDRNRCNNVATNLRWCSRQQNSYNSKIRTDNMSGIKGVHEDEHGRWISQTSFNGARIRARFENKDDAISHRLSTTEKYYDENFFK